MKSPPVCLNQLNENVNCRRIVDMRCYQPIPFPIPSLPSWEEELPTRPVSYHPAHRSIIDLAAICHRCDVNANVFCNNCTALRRIDIINTRPSGVGGGGGSRGIPFSDCIRSLRNQSAAAFREKQLARQSAPSGEHRCVYAPIRERFSVM